MPIGTSNYPNGFLNGVTIRGVPILQTNPGRVFWVSNNTTGLLPGQRGGSNGNKGDFNSPLATLAAAAALCVANRGDIIVVKPGHAETVASATALALSIAGVAIIGLGVGSQRPKFTLNTANTATIAVSADNISIQNCQFFGNFLSIAACFTLTTAKWFTLQNNYFSDTSGVLNFLNIVKSTGAANTVDGLTLVGNVWKGLGTTSVNSFALVADAIDQATLRDNRILLTHANDTSNLLKMTTGAATNLEVGDNVIVSKQTANTAGTLLDVGASSTGFVYRNFAGTLVTAGDKLFTTTVGIYPFENRVSGVVGATGFVIPAVDS